MSYIIHKNTSSTTRLQNTYSCLLKNMFYCSIFLMRLSSHHTLSSTHQKSDLQDRQTPV